MQHNVNVTMLLTPASGLPGDKRWASRQQAADGSLKHVMHIHLSGIQSEAQNS